MLHFGLYIIVIIVVILITLMCYRWCNPRCNGTLPPGTMGFPVIGETIHFIKPGNSLDIIPFYKKRIQRYGKLFKTSILGTKAVVSIDPEVNHFLLQQEGKLVQMWYLDVFDVIFEKGAMSNEADRTHKQIKGILLAHFGSEGLKDTMLPKLEECVRETLRQWALLPSMEVKQALSSMVSTLVIREMLSYDTQNSSIKYLSKLFANFLDGLISIPLNIPGTPFYNCLKAQKQMVKVMAETIKERMKWPNTDQTDNGDFLDRIIRVIKVNKMALTDDAIAHTIFGFLVASSESLPTVISLALKLVNDHPSVLKELKEEHEAILKNRDDLNSGITWKEYKSLTFTSQVINEVLRMTIGPGNFRKALKDVNVGGYTIPAGWCIIINHSAVNMDPNTFTDPHVFNPWRWKQGEAGVSTKCFTPFGGGIRSCPASEFSKLLIAIFLHVLVTDYRWTVIKGEQVTVKKGILSFGEGFHIKVWEKK